MTKQKTMAVNTPRLTEHEDGFYLEGRKVHDGDVVERLRNGGWTPARIWVAEQDGIRRACFVRIRWVGDEPTPGDDFPNGSDQLNAPKCELRWPPGERSLSARA